MKESIIHFLRQRYFLSHEGSWDDIARRMCEVYPDMLPHIQAMEYLPSSPTLMNFNTKGEKIGTLSSCFTMDIQDSIEGIFDAIKECAIVTKNGGGVGYNVSALRGSSELVSGINRPSSGPLPFIGVINSTLDSIMQGGVRRGAGMAMLDIDHRDILSFVTAKLDTSLYTRLNFSVRVSDKFYQQLETNPDEPWIVKNRVDGHEFALKDTDGNVVSARRLWDTIIECAWKSGEPGIFNCDIATRQCPVVHLGTNVLSNPCSEFVSVPYLSCNLGSINVSKFVHGKRFNWDGFEALITKSVRYIDTLIDLNHYPLDRIRQLTLQARPIGLGCMGVAHALYKKEIPYNSERGYKFADELIKYLTLRSIQESVELAKEKGACEAFDYDIYMNAFIRFFEHDGEVRNISIGKLQKDIKRYGVRNVVTTSIAPTGSISFIADCSSGIEPVFALTYERKIEVGNKEYESVYITDPVFEEYLDSNYDETKKTHILKHIVEHNGSCQTCELIPENMRHVFVVAGDIHPLEHLEFLERVSRNCSTSVSKTINLPYTSTREDVSGVYINAHKKGIIGVTVYRDGSREGVLLHKGSDRPSKLVFHHAPKRPQVLDCDVHRITSKGEKWIAFVGLIPVDGNDSLKSPFEIFCGKIEDVNLPKNIITGKLIKVTSGHYSFEYDGEVLIGNILKTFNNEDHDDFARMVSLSLRSGVMIAHLCDTLRKSKGGLDKFSKVLARVLKVYIPDGELASGKCEICGSKLVYRNGCIECSNPLCGNTRCG